jgi:hypothetical protein
VLDGAEPWRFLTSVFLHAGLIHLAFNLMSLAVVGPQVEEDYGRWPMLFLFVVTGVFAAVASRYTGMDGVGIGASGAVMGLIGVAAAAGHRAGNTRGKHRRNDMLKWAAYCMFFGFIVRADNRAHLAGFVLGGAIGLLVPPRLVVRTRVARVIGGILGGFAMVAMLAAVALTMVPHERYPMVPWMPDTGLLLFDQSSGDPGDLDDTGTAIWACNQYRHGNAEIVEYYGGAGMLEEVCTSLEQWRLECAGKVDPACDEIHRLGGLLAPK